MPDNHPSAQHRDSVPATADPSEDIDARFRNLLAGLRTTLPGAAILLSFLLSFPLQAGFSEFLELQRRSYFVALVSTSLATLLLIAPSAQARVRYPASGLRRETIGHVLVGAYVALAGTLFLFIGVIASLFLIFSVVFELWLAIVTVVAIGIAGLATWFGLPVYWNLQDRRDPD